MSECTCKVEYYFGLRVFGVKRIRRGPCHAKGPLADEAIELLRERSRQYHLERTDDDDNMHDGLWHACLAEPCASDRALLQRIEATP